MIYIKIICLIVSFAYAQGFPNSITFTGELMENGMPVNDTVSITFSFEGHVWTQVSSIFVENGIYMTEIGSDINPIPLTVFDQGAPHMMQISVNGAMMEELPINYVPFARVAEKAFVADSISNTVDTLKLANVIKLGDNSLYLKGYNTANVNPTNEIFTDGDDLLIQNGDLNTKNTIINAGGSPGKVGIGTNSPTNKLHIESALNPLRIEGLQELEKDSVLVVDGEGVVYWRDVNSFPGSGGSSDDDWEQRLVPPGIIPPPPFNTDIVTGISSTYNPSLNDGRVGIGVGFDPYPNADWNEFGKLEIKGEPVEVGDDGYRFPMRIRSSSLATVGKVLFEIKESQMISGENEYGGSSILNMYDYAGGKKTHLSTGGINWLNGGFMGIGNQFPTNRLHVTQNSGNPLRIEGLQELEKDSVLVVDGEGVVYWRDANSLNGSGQADMDWEVSGNGHDVFTGHGAGYPVNVGIGTSTPVTNLDINGGVALDIIRIYDQTTLSINHRVVLCDLTNDWTEFIQYLPPATEGLVITYKVVADPSIWPYGSLRALNIYPQVGSLIDWGEWPYYTLWINSRVTLICDGTDWWTISN